MWLGEIENFRAKCQRILTTGDIKTIIIGVTKGTITKHTFVMVIPTVQDINLFYLLRTEHNFSVLGQILMKYMSVHFAIIRRNFI